MNNELGVLRRPKLPEIHFVQMEYRQGRDLPVACLPDVCPYFEVGEGSAAACRVALHHLRERKTGSVPRIVVCECRTHQKAFGLYPPDGVPYARVPWSPVGPAGEALRVVEDEPPPDAERELSSRLTSFLPTYPGAAVDEGRAVTWPDWSFWRGLPSDTQPRRETQVRRSLRCLRVLGVDGSGVGEPDRLGISEVLEIPLAVLRAMEEGLLPVGEAGAPLARGWAAWEALEALPEVSPVCLAHRLAVAGYLAGVWGQPWVFDVYRGRYWSEPFRRRGTKGPTV